MQTIYLDISNKGVIPCIQAKQSEVGRKFLAVITDSGLPCEIKSDSVISVWYEGASGKGNYTDIGNKSAISVTKNRITVELIAQMLAVPGNGVITLLINSANGDQIGLWNIDYCVEENAGVESEKAEDYYTAFSEAAAKLAKSAENINSAIKAKNATAAGLIYPLASANVPSGFLLCDGAEYSRADYAELFEAIGTVYGIGDGETTFNVPNLQTRVPIGVGDGYELGATGGEEKHQLTIEELPSHSHYQTVANILDGSSVVQDSTVLYTSGEKQTSFIGRLQDEATGGDQPHDNMQPYTVVNYIISTGKKVEFVIGGGGCLIDDNTIGADAWSSKNIVDRLCPPISETGLVAQCDAVEGYPLDVQAKESGEVSGITVTVCGKNLYNAKDYPMTDDRFINNGNGDDTTTTSGYCATLDYIPVSHLVGQKIYLNYRPGGSAPGMMFYRANKIYMPGTGGKGDGITVPEGAAFMRFTSLKANKDEIQIEIGEKATTYEPYSRDVFNVSGDGLGELIPVPGIIGRSGVTTIFAYDGEENATEVKVSGRADPNAKIRRLTDDVAELKAAILTMGANV
jgi:microcystin-dependent protein